MNNIRKAIAELVGTFTLVFAGCGSIMIADRYPGSISPNIIPVIFGLAVASMIYAVGHISGAHFNPAVTLAFAIVRHFPKREVFVYWIAQVLGALLAIALLWLLLPTGKNYGATIPTVSWFQAVNWEIILTFFLMFVIISVATDTRAVGVMAGAAIGITVIIGAFIGGPITGASMNPARSLAPAIAQGRLNVIWIYILGPFLGAILAAFLYQWIRCENSTENKPNTNAAKGCC